MTDQILRPVEGRRHIPIPGGRITMSSPHYQLIAHNGRTYLMEWDHRWGPVFLKRDGEGLHNQPSERHPVWPAFRLWIDQGKLVDQDNRCVWRDAPVEAVQLSKTWEPATETTMARIKALTEVNTGPAKWDAAFVRGMSSYLVAPAPRFTERQERHIARLCRKYHRQIDDSLVPGKEEWL